MVNDILINTNNNPATTVTSLEAIHYNIFIKPSRIIKLRFKTVNGPKDNPIGFDNPQGAGQPPTPTTIRSA